MSTSILPRTLRNARLTPLLPAAVLGALIPALAFAAQLSFSRHQLSNGAVLLVSEQHSVPMVVVQMFVEAGSRRDPAGKEGLASLTADLLTEGTKKRSAVQLSEETDALGARLSTSADVDFAQLSLTVLSKYLDRGLDILFEILLQPSFPSAEVNRRKQAALAAIAAEQDNPGQLAYRNFLRLIFGPSPYGHPPIGERVSVERLTRSDVVDFYRRYYRPNGTVIAVTGDVETAKIVQRFEQSLSSWRAQEVAGFPEPTFSNASSRVFTLDKPLTQTNIVMGHRGVARDNPDFYAITVMNFILGGGGFTSRLVESVRVEGGLAYSVGSQFTAHKSAGTFQITMQTKNASAGDAIRRACAELRRIQSDLVSEDELANAQQYLTGSFPLRLDSNTKIAAFLAQVEFYGLGQDYIEQYMQRIRAVTREDVQRVAQRYLHPEDVHLVAIGNLSEAKLPQAAVCSEGP
ncbi:MAG: insulinase family protein [Candidatus Binatia bacterium]|nr:insulinase family protein [Candidatus Binatia bacterium]